MLKSVRFRKYLTVTYLNYANLLGGLVSHMTTGVAGKTKGKAITDLGNDF